jgi:hypothetical protein
MHAFISHNKHDKADARILALALVESGASVWFDEWDIAPGESLISGIEEGLEACDTFILLWSAAAKESNWVGTELRAFIRRRVEDHTLRVIPIIIGDVKLPALVAEYRGFPLDKSSDLNSIANEIIGSKSHFEVAATIQKRLWELSKGKIPIGSPHRYIVCPQCGGEIIHSFFYDHSKEKNCAAVMCQSCKFHAAEFV